MRGQRAQQAESHALVFQIGSQGVLALAKSLLHSASIACLVANDRAGDYFCRGRFGGGNPAVRPIKIRVSLEDKDTARQILAEIGVARQHMPLVARVIIVPLFLLPTLIAAIINTLR